jgi:hypothetical protein
MVNYRQSMNVVMNGTKFEHLVSLVMSDTTNKITIHPNRFNCPLQNSQPHLNFSIITVQTNHLGDAHRPILGDCDLMALNLNVQLI